MRTAPDVVAFQLAVEGGAADPQHLARQHLVSFYLFEDALDGVAFDEQVKGDKVLAGKMLGISRATLYRKLKRYNIGSRPHSSPSPPLQSRGRPQAGSRRSILRVDADCGPGLRRLSEFVSI